VKGSVGTGASIAPKPDADGEQSASLSSPTGAKVSGPAECSPGAICGLLRLVLDETEAHFGARPGAGIVLGFSFRSKGDGRGGASSGVYYRTGRGRAGHLVALNYCPFCGVKRDV
jgi:hypothetical protein